MINLRPRRGSARRLGLHPPTAQRIRLLQYAGLPQRWIIGRSDPSEAELAAAFAASPGYMWSVPDTQFSQVRRAPIRTAGRTPR